MPDSSQGKRSQSYYFDDGNIVECELFRVHRHFLLRDSVVFQDLLKLPTSVGQDVEGLSDDNPIVLSGIKGVDFSRLLWIFYNPNYGVYSASVDEWRSILYLADMWEFDTIRQLAIDKLGEILLDPVEQLEISNRYKIGSEWSAKSMKALSNRKEPLTYNEAERVGLAASLNIAHARETSLKEKIREMEEKLAGRIDRHCSKCADRSRYGATRRLEEALA